MDPRILSVGTALPPHVYTQEVVKARTAAVFARSSETADLLSIFDNAGVLRRHFVRDADFYLAKPGFRERNRVYLEEAVRLGAEAVRNACARAAVEPREVGHIIFVSTTGVATPSPDAFLVGELGLRQDVLRTPLFGVGCAGGAVALSRAASFARLDPGALIAVVAFEACSLTFLQDDLTPKNVVATALFGDGAAAALVAGGELAAGRGAALVASHSHLFPRTPDYMGWEVSEHGLELVLSPRVPVLVGAELPGLARAFLARRGLKVGDISRFVFHPGGPRILEAVAAGLGVAREALAPTWNFLANHGNLSSASLLFVLETVLAAGPSAGERGLAVAFGPGFAAEMLLLNW